MDNNPSESGMGSDGVDQAKAPADVSTADQWRATIDRQEQSGLGPVMFCRAEGIAKSTFFTARRRLAARAAAAKTPFVPVTLKPRATREVTAPHGRSAALELRLSGRRRVILRRGFDPDLLRHVVRVLENLDTPEGRAS